MKKLNLLLIIICLCFLSCKTVEPNLIIIPDAPSNPEIINITDINSASMQINILIIQEFKWRLVYLDTKWIIGLISDEEREIEKLRILSILDKLTNKD